MPFVPPFKQYLLTNGKKPGTRCSKSGEGRAIYNKVAENRRQRAAAMRAPPYRLTMLTERSRPANSGL